MKYCEPTTIGHQKSGNHPEILSKFIDVLRSEGCALNPTPFSQNDYIVINGDKLEEVTAISDKRRKNKSVDVIFGKKSIEGSIKEFQLVELKLRTQDCFFLDKFSLRDKTNSSISALGNSENISKIYFIVFKKEVLNVAERYLFRTNPKLNNDFKAIDVARLHQHFFQ